MFEGLDASRVTITLSFALSAIASLFLLLPKLNNHHLETPFTGIFIITTLYWIITLLLQFLFITKVFFNANVSQANQANIIAVVGPHFTFSNIINFFWCYFFTREKYLIAEILLVVNLLNLLMLYFSHKTNSIKNIQDWLTIHLPVTGIPLSWTLYAIFWNGACLFHSHNKSLAARILANIFIWEFLLVPMTLLLLFSDWSVGLSTSFLMLGVGLNQMLTKLIALQWIFAFVISGLDFVFSILSMFNTALRQVETESTSNDQAPLLA
jgi:hypothetical protein